MISHGPLLILAGLSLLRLQLADAVPETMLDDRPPLRSGAYIEVFDSRVPPQIGGFGCKLAEVQGKYLTCDGGAE